MNVDVLEKLKDYVSIVEDYLLSIYGDGAVSLLDLDHETEKIKSWIEDLESDMEVKSIE